MSAMRDRGAAHTAKSSSRLATAIMGGSGVALTGRAMSIASILAFAAGLAGGLEAAVAVLTIVGLLTLTAFLRSPDIGMLGVVMLCVLDVPLRVYVLTDYALPYNSFNYLLLALGVGAVPFLLGSGVTPGKWLTGFIVIALLQLLPSSNQELGMLVLLEVVAGLALMAAMVRWGRDAEFLRWAAIVASVTSAACLLAYLVNRPDSPINANSLAQIPLAGLVVIAFAAARSDVIRNWPLMNSLVTLNLVLVFLTESRGTFVLGALLGVYVIMRSPGVIHKVLVISLFSGMFIWMATAFAQEFGATADKWARFMDPDVSLSQSTNRRVDLAEVGWIIFQENPLGAGTGSFSDFEGYQFGEMAHIRRAAHSAWVKVMAENGVPGLVFLVGFVLSYVFMRNRTDPQVGRSWGPFVAVVLALSFISVEFQSKSLWLLCASAALFYDRGPVAAGAGARNPQGMRASVLQRPDRRGVTP